MLHIRALAIAVAAMALFLSIPVTPAVSATTFYVNSTADDGDVNPGNGVCDDGTVVPQPNINASLQCTLRAAIEEANASQGPDIIAFDIPGTGMQTISPGSQLPTITDSVAIEGYTQPGAFQGWLPNDNVLRIELSGLEAGLEANGLVVAADHTTIQGLVINAFGLRPPPLREVAGPEVSAASEYGTGILVLSVGGVGIEANYIGTDASGTQAYSNGGDGLRFSGSYNNEIVGNLISGNVGDGVVLSSTVDTRVSRNLIGTDLSGTQDLGNGLSGVLIRVTRGFRVRPDAEAGAIGFYAGNAVGGESPDGNVISGNGRMGVEITGRSAHGNRVAGNYIGTDITGYTPLGNGLAGVGVIDVGEGPLEANRIGGYWEGDRNVISANGGPGIHVKASESNTIAGNYIGTDWLGTAAMGNAGGGVLIESARGNSVGEYGNGNLISGNNGPGIEIRSGGWNSVYNNLIGTDAGGMLGMPNSVGVRILDTQEVSIGAPDPYLRNVISGNTDAGVVIEGPSAFANSIEGNYIGTDRLGNGAIPNGTGVRLGGQGNNVGGYSIESRNLVSGNTLDGIQVTGSQNLIVWNHIGINQDGTVAVSNGRDGLAITGPGDNYVGEPDGSKGNVISGNGRHGVNIQGPRLWYSNRLNGNYIGTNATGDGAIGNGVAGVRIVDQSGNIVGSTNAGNVISGNGGAGVEILATDYPAESEHNFVQGNRIGTNAAGTARLANGGDGVSIVNGRQNFVGGTASGEGNLISGNEQNGVGIDFPRANDNRIEGNLIGTDVTGSLDIGNGADGVNIDSAPGNIVGGTTPGSRNVISGNDRHGIEVKGSVFDSASGNRVEGNYIGTDVSGHADLGNALAGVRITEATFTVVGGTSLGARNLISGNNSDGVGIACCNGYGNRIEGNYIGVNVTGTAALGNSDYGVVVFSPGNIVGGAVSGARNVISGNAPAGVFIIGDFNEVLGNFIGTDAAGDSPIGNAAEGVLIQGGFGNKVGGPSEGARNRIAFNGRDGVRVDGAIHNSHGTIQGNSAFTNGARGIENIDGGNGEISPPVITGIGSASGTACGSCTVDVYSDNEDEGRVYHGSAVADGSGNWSFAGEVAGPNVTATATDGGGNTSEFSLPLGCLDTDGDGACDTAHQDYDRDGVNDTDEAACGSAPSDPSSRPERFDGPFAGVDDNGDTRIDETIHYETSYYRDCDGDGYDGGVEFHVGTGDQDACGQDGWPSDLVTGRLRPNMLNIEDVGSFIVPVRRLGTREGDAGFDSRWDVGYSSSSEVAIDIVDLAALITSKSGHPPMFGGTRAFGKTCPWAP